MAQLVSFGIAVGDLQTILLTRRAYIETIQFSIHGNANGNDTIRAATRNSDAEEVERIADGYMRKTPRIKVRNSVNADAGTIGIL